MPLRLTKEQAKSFLSKYEDELQKFQSSMQHSIRHSLRCDTQFVPNIINALQSIANGSDFNPQVATSGMSSFKSLPEDPNACLTALLSYNENSIVNFDHLIEFYQKAFLEQQKHLSDRKLQSPDFSKLAQFNAEINQLLGQKKSIPKDADLSEQLEIYSAKLQDTTGRRRLFKTDALIPQADKPRVAIKFSSKLQKEQFILNLIQEVNNPVYEQIKRDKLLKDIEKLFSTIEGQQHENILYIEPSSGPDSFGTYISHGKLAVNFGDQIIRNAFVKLTGLNEQHTEIYHSSKQNNALYFHAAKLPVEPDPNQRTSIQVQAPKYISYQLYAPENVDTVNDAIDCNGLLQGLSSFDHNGQLPNHIKTVIQQQIKHGKTENDIKLQIAEDANNSHPILHADVLKLIENFLIEKKKNGSEEEKLLYANMSTEDFITRLLTKRPLAFYGPHDATRYRDGVPLSLKEYISYEEMQISAFLGMSSPSYFINDGARYNKGISAKDTFIERGVVVGQVGARFERSDAMEYQHMLITRQQNTPQNGYGLSLDDSTRQQPLKSYWAKFYGIDYFPTYAEARAQYKQELSNKTEPKTYIKVNTHYLNVNVYKQRMKKVVETFLLEANARAAATDPPQKAYVHATGLGLGVWAIALEQQTNLLLEAYVEVLKEHKLEHIADIDFSWFDKATIFNGNRLELPTRNSYDQIVNSNLGTQNSHIAVHFSKNNPYQETVAKANKLLVSQYAWDSGSFPGNEFWDGALTASGDPAEACASGITYLQSSINPKVKGKYTMLAGKGNELTRFSERDDVKKQPGKVVQAETQEKEQQHKQLICSQEAVKQDTLDSYINGVDCIDVADDGNCFYYAVAAAFNVQNKELPPCNNQTLRQKVVDYIKTLDNSIVSALFIADKEKELQQDIDNFKSTIKTLEKPEDKEDKKIAKQRIEELTKEITDLDNQKTNVALYQAHKEAYIKDIIEGKKWADGLSIDALSKALNRTIVVMGQHKTDGAEGEPKIIHIVDVQSDNSPIFIHFNGEDHYRALIVQPGYDGKEILEREKAKSAPSLQTHSDRPLTPEPTKSPLDKVSKQLYSVEIQAYFDSEDVKTRLLNIIIYQPILPLKSSNKDIIGEIRSTDTVTTAQVEPNTVLASIHKDSIKCPIVSDDKTHGQLIDVQQGIFLEFLKFQSNKASKEDPITIEANNFSPKDLSVLLDLLNKESPKLFVNLQLPSSAEECRYGNNKQYTPQEFDNIKNKIEQYNNKSNQDPASPDESRHHPGPKSH